MKKQLTFFYLFFFVVQCISAQKADTTLYSSSQPLYNGYLEKAKINHTAAWATLGTGIAMMGIGTYVYTIQAIGEGDVGSAGPILFYLGATSTLVSIPLFIRAGQNKRKANLSLKKESVFIGDKLFRKSGYTALSIALQL